MKKEEVEKYLISLYNRVYAIYSPIAIRAFRLLSDSDNEWNTFVGEKQTVTLIRNNYFLPMLCLLFVFQFFSACVELIFNEDAVISSLFAGLIVTIMVSFVCYTLTELLVLLIGSSPKSRIFYLGENLDKDKVSTLIIFPFCISMFAQVLENIWDVFFPAHFIAVFLSLMLVWKGLTYIVPGIEKTSSKHTWCTIAIGMLPILLNVVCTKILKI